MIILLLLHNNNNNNMKFDHYLTCRLPPQVKREFFQVTSCRNQYQTRSFRVYLRDLGMQCKALRIVARNDQNPSLVLHSGTTLKNEKRGPHFLGAYSKAKRKWKGGGGNCKSCKSGLRLRSNTSLSKSFPSLCIRGTSSGISSSSFWCNASFCSSSHPTSVLLLLLLLSSAAIVHCHPFYLAPKWMGEKISGRNNL